MKLLPCCERDNLVMSCDCIDKRIAVSFSGGRSSAVMAAKIREAYPNHEIKFIFMNTGQEHPKTIEFVKKCDEYFKLDLILLESVQREGRKSSGFRVVTYDTLSMHGQPFEAMIRKYGIPNLEFPHCTRELKENPFKNYLRSVGWYSYYTALGIRADEPKRIKKRPNVIYPLNEWGLDKQDVLDFWKEMPFDLEIQEREGNCLWCWKKSLTKHVLNLKSNPEWYDFPEAMERDYALQRTDLKPEPRVFFREHRSTAQMRKIAAMSGANDKMTNRPDEDAGCSESCEVFL